MQLVQLLLDRTNETINARAGLISNFYFSLPDGLLKIAQ